MKRYLLIFALLLGAVSSWGQSKTDQEKVIQQCFNLPELQQYFPMGADQSPREVYIVNKPTAFSNGLELSKFGKAVIFVTNAVQLQDQQVAYFVFNHFAINGNTATATFDFNYTLSTYKTILNYTVVLNKTGNTWNVTETKLNRR